MLTRQRASVLTAALLCFAISSWLSAEDKPLSQDQRRDAAHKANRDGNYKDAYEHARRLALDEKADPLKVGTDLELGIACLRQLGRVDEVDAFREAVLAVHGNNWRL